MRASFSAAAIFAATTASALFAGVFWDQTGPESWTQAQVEELLTDSPWAKPANVKFLGDRGGSGVPGVGLPGGRGRSGGGSRIPGGGGWPGAGGGIGFPWTNQARDSDNEATVVWTSALPIRQALARIGVVEQLRDVHAKDFYIVTVDGLPFALAPLAETPDLFRRSARLELESGAAIRAERVEVRPRPGAPAIELYFRRDEAASTAEKTIAFVMTAGEYSIEAKFKPSEMVYRDQIEM